MPEGLTVAISRDDDPFAWALNLAEKLRHRQGALTALDREALGEFLEEWADNMLAAARSQMANLLAHAAKVAHTRNPDVIGHWRSECTEFHDRLIDEYRPSMHDRIDMDALWRRAQRKVFASFDDNGEPRPQLPTVCPVGIDQLIDQNLNIDRLVATIKGT
jgi:hypothetical protein